MENDLKTPADRLARKPNKILGDYIEEFETILDNKEWEKVQPFYIEMEQNGFAEEVPSISELMMDEDLKEYKAWDERVNGSTEVQMDDASDQLQAKDVIFDKESNLM